MKLLKLKAPYTNNDVLKSSAVINHGSTFLYAASQEMIAMLERQKERSGYPDCEVVQILNNQMYTYVLFDTYNFDFSVYFEHVNAKGEKIEK